MSVTPRTPCRCTHRQLAGCAAVMLVVLAGSARGSDWNFQENAAVTLGYVTNPQLLPDVASDDEVATAAMSASLQRVSETSLLQLTPRIKTAQYRTMNDLDNTDGGLALGWQSAGQKTSWYLDSQAAVESTLTSELGLSGITQVNRQQRTLSADVGGTTNWSELTQIGYQLSGARVNYRDAAGTGLSDYGYLSASVDPSWSVGQLARLTVTLQADSLGSDTVKGRQRDYAANIGFSRQADEHNKWRLQGGASGVDTGDSIKVGWIVDAGWSRQAEFGSFALSVRRKIAPVGNGLLARSDSLSTDVSHSFTEHTTWSLSAQLVRSARIEFDTLVLFDGSLWGNVGTQWRWDFARHWSSALSASRSTVENGLSGGPWARSWEAHWSINWQDDQQ